MTTNIRIVPRNFHDEATLTASTEATLFPVTETQNSARDNVWRSTSTATATISGTFSRSRVVNFFGMFYHRNQGSSIRVQCYTDAAWSSAATGGDTGTVSINKVVGGSGDTGFQWGDDPYGTGQYDPLIAEQPYWYYFPANVTLQSYKVTFSSHVTTFWSDAFWHTGRLWLGKYFQPRINPAYNGNGLAWQDNTERNRTRGGSLRTNVGFRWRQMKMTLEEVDETESPVWFDILARSGTGKDLVVSLFPEDGTRRERDNIACCKFKSLNDIVRQMVNRSTLSLQVEEI